MNIRQQRQQEAFEAFDGSCGKTILLAAPRLGKCAISLKLLEDEIGRFLICFPRNDIKKSWEDEMNRLGIHLNQENQGVEYCTFTSLHKIEKEKYSFIIIDEIHEASYKQLSVLGTLVANCNKCLGLTGTMTGTTKYNIAKLTGLGICWEYTIPQAIEDGILCDYTIWIHKVNMLPGEKRKWDADIKLRAKLKEEGKQYRWIDLKLGLKVKTSPAKIRKTRELIEDYYAERLLIFCGTTEIADSLEIPAYHSKAKEVPLLQAFCRGEGMHLATVNMMQSGLTIAPINKGIFQYLSGAPESGTQRICRFLGYEYLSPDKKASLHIITTNEPFELERLNTSLTWFDKSKIIVLEDKNT